MKNIVIAPMGDYMDSLYVGLKEFPTEKVVLLCPQNYKKEVEAVKKDLEKFKIDCHVINVKGETEIEIWEGVFMAVAQVRNSEKDKEILVNVSTGDRVTRCAATSAAFVNGVKAFATSGELAMMLPVMRFNYYKVITDKKMEILKILNESGLSMHMDDLGKKIKMSLPLVSYHINGNMKSEGLKDMGLIDTTEEKGRVIIKLSTLGRLIVRGYVKNPEE
jgi:DNA-binding transcriptional ArsR family regulator